MLPRTLRIDRVTENDIMATILCFLQSKQGDLDDSSDSVMYGLSTQNKIERWRRELHDRMEKYFKSQFSSLVECGHYDSSDQTDRLAFNIPAWSPQNPGNHAIKKSTYTQQFRLFINTSSIAM